MRLVQLRQQLIEEILLEYRSLSHPLEQQIALETVADFWIESADEIPLRKHTLSIVRHIDHHTVQLAVGKVVTMPEQIEDIRRAISCLVILGHEPQTRQLVRRMMRALILWVLKEDVAEDLLLQPILRRIDSDQLRGIEQQLSS